MIISIEKLIGDLGRNIAKMIFQSGLSKKKTIHYNAHRLSYSGKIGESIADRLDSLLRNGQDDPV